MKWNALRFLGVFVAFAAMETADGQGCLLERVSVNSLGMPSNGDCGYPIVSSDGRFISFNSSATNLVPGDTNFNTDAFLVDRATHVVEITSVNSSGVQGNDWSAAGSMSPDGRFVVFVSRCTNLDPRDTDTVPDVYLRDRLLQTTELASVRLGTGPSLVGCFGTSVSADGRYVAFDCVDSNVLPNVFGNAQCYVRDVLNQTTELVSVGPQGTFAPIGSYRPSMSGDGRFVAFTSESTNWFPTSPFYQSGVYIRDRQQSITTPVTMNELGVMGGIVANDPVFSEDGRFLLMRAVPKDILPAHTAHGIEDMVRWDRVTGALENVSLGFDGNRLDHLTHEGSISGDGRLVVYRTDASNSTVDAIQWIVLRDIETGATKGIAANDLGEVANGLSYVPAISADGRVTAFASSATNLLPGANGAYQIYVRACNTAKAIVYCVAASGATGCKARMDTSGEPSASAGAGFVVSVKDLPGVQPTVLLHSTQGAWGAPLASGILCIRPPFKRSTQGSSGGTAGACDGTFSLDINAAIQAGHLAGVGAGSKAYLQLWSRDGAGGGQLSDAVAFVVEP